MSKPPSLHSQIAAIAEAVADVTARLDRIEHVAPVVEGSLSAVLAYGLRTSRQIPAIYYGIFGALYLAAALTFFLGTSGLGLLIEPWRAIIGISYLAVGIGNLSCIWLSSTTYQVRMAFPTIVAAALILILNSIQDVRMDRLPSVIGTVITWGAISTGHAFWAVSTPARVKYKKFTQGFLERSRAQDQKELGTP